MDDLELKKRREKMRRLGMFRDRKKYTDEDLNRRILRKEEKAKYQADAKGETPAEGEPRLVIFSAEDAVDVEWRPMFRQKVKEFLPGFLDSDLNAAIARASAEVAAAAYLSVFIAYKFHADERSKKDAIVAFKTSLDAGGQAAAQRKGKIGEDDILEAISASQKNLAKGKEGRAERLRKVEERIARRPQSEAEPGNKAEPGDEDATD